jgi:hypothetical protein
VNLRFRPKNPETLPPSLCALRVMVLDEAEVVSAWVLASFARDEDEDELAELNEMMVGLQVGRDELKVVAE